MDTLELSSDVFNMPKSRHACAPEFRGQMIELVPAIHAVAAVGPSMDPVIAGKIVGARDGETRVQDPRRPRPSRGDPGLASGPSGSDNIHVSRLRSAAFSARSRYRPTHC